MMMPGQHHQPHHAMSSTRSRSLRRAEVPVAFGPGGSPSKQHSYLNSLSQPASVRGSPIGIGGARGILSPTSARHRPQHHSTALGRHPYGASRSSNNSPLTLPMEHLPQSLSTSSAYGAHGFPGYYDDPGSPGAMDGVGLQSAGGRPMHRMGRRPPLRSYHSIEREPGYRDRSFDRMDSLNARSGGGGHRGPRDRSLDRALYSSTRDDPMHSSAYGLRDRDGALLDDPPLGSAYGRDPLGHTARGAALHGMGPPPPGGGAFGVDPRAPYGGVPSSATMSGRMGAVNDNFVMELQARLNDLQNQFGSVKRELDATTQKLGSSMHSIKTFWSPELKKERALRKEEAAKYALINDQLKILRSENQVKLKQLILLSFS